MQAASKSAKSPRQKKSKRYRQQEEIQSKPTVSLRVAASRRNGKRGGIATSNRHSQEWKITRAASGGLTTKARYGTEYFRHIRSLRRTWKKRQAC